MKQKKGELNKEDLHNPTVHQTHINTNKIPHPTTQKATNRQTP